jgi:hypothetical protein
MCKKKCKARKVAIKACDVLRVIPEPRCQQAATTCDTLLDEEATPRQKFHAIAQLTLALTH